MRDIESLKRRIESAEKHNASTEMARNRESEALLDMWHQIRTRFTDQEDEIARYRMRLEEMTQKNSDLGRMVDDLLATVEGNLDRSRDDTVPRITNLAQELLASEPSSFAATEQSDNQIDGSQEEDDGSSFDDAMMAIAHIDDDVEPESDADQAGNSVPDPDVVRSVLDLIASGNHDDAAADDHLESPAETTGPVEAESLSAGIRDIISRVEKMGSAVHMPAPPPAPAAEPARSEDPNARSDEFLTELLGSLKNADENTPPVTQTKDALDQELREIEDLRNELSGLRSRISTGGSAN
ncbi:MAG: hypothetical protein HQ514_13265 [Rhodospirillales bacterium]|nr:hypothetical protein [Rhodospirillales bacterium]